MLLAGQEQARRRSFNHLRGGISTSGGGPAAHAGAGGIDVVSGGDMIPPCFSAASTFWGTK